MTNVIKHAQADHCWITLQCIAHPPKMQITIEDDGAGLPPAVVPNVGLHSMREQAEELGGSGTTGLALCSGIPSMVIPFTADQPFWGARTHALGVGDAPIPFSRMTAENLAQAIQIMTQSTDMQRQAVLLRDAMATENGIKQAVGVIQRYLT